MRTFSISTLLICSILSFNIQASDKPIKVPAYKFSHSAILNICSVTVNKSNNFVSASREYVDSIKAICLSEIFHSGHYSDNHILIHKNDLKSVCNNMHEDYIKFSKDENFSNKLLINHYCLKTIIENHSVKFAPNFPRLFEHDIEKVENL